MPLKVSGNHFVLQHCSVHHLLDIYGWNDTEEVQGDAFMLIFKEFHPLF